MPHVAAAGLLNKLLIDVTEASAGGVAPWGIAIITGRRGSRKSDDRVGQAAVSGTASPA
jgi:hypothetical protein